MKTERNMPLRMMTLIDCIAAMPLAGVRRPSAVMMHTEKMKNNPAMSPEPSAARNIVALTIRSISVFLPKFRWRQSLAHSRQSRAAACPTRV